MWQFEVCERDTNTPLQSKSLLLDYWMKKRAKEQELFDKKRKSSMFAVRARHAPSKLKFPARIGCVMLRTFAAVASHISCYLYL